MEIEALVAQLLENRGLTKKAEIARFFQPPLPAETTLSAAGLSPTDVKKALRLIKTHQQAGYQIAVYGDYDVDGICATAILWEALYRDYKHVFPYIPHRESEGYGLSEKGIDHCLSQGAKLIIAVDNGIVAHHQIKYCQARGCDIIVIDHHEASDQRPKANCVLHSTSTCAAALTWLVARQLTPLSRGNQEQLTLVAIALICDLVPLVGISRSFAKFGLEELNRTRRPGLLALCQEAGIQPGFLGTWEAGFVIGPRLNSMGRLEHAIDSLRLLCTADPGRARELAQILGQTNRTRQDLTQAAAEQAIAQVGQAQLDQLPKLLFVGDSSWSAGIIGLVASKLVDKYHRPAIVVAVGSEYSKASARSVAGFHITQAIRTTQELLVDVGGHAMAAGFTVETAKLEAVKQRLSDLAQETLDPKLLVRQRRIDIEIPLSAISHQLYARLEEFKPFGLGNPQPVFLTKDVSLTDCRLVGAGGRHFKCRVGERGGNALLPAIWFNGQSTPAGQANIVYSIAQDSYSGQSQLQLIVKDLYV